MARQVPETLRVTSKSLRSDSTAAEVQLWSHLRNRGLAGAKFRRQHPIGNYIVDFYCAAGLLVVEIDGLHHLEPEQAYRDEGRTAYLEEQGLRVLRFSNRQVLTETGAVLDQILAALKVPSP